ncbi:MAG: N-acetylmuramoyl-L-alanine amidase AmiD precursor [Bacteroidota bacterium]|jgi:N-acetylmuramoyl-L-alanine amidase
MKNYLYTIIGILIISSCSVNPYRLSTRSYKKQLKVFQKTIGNTNSKPLQNGNNPKWISTVNFNLRKPNFVVIHHTAQDSLQQTLKTFTLTKTQVSAHYVISNDGTVVQMLNDYLRAWHGGNASWGKNTDINSASIGIELDNNGTEPFSEAQINSLIALLSRLKKDYNIPTANFIAHSDIAPSRKSDPSSFFPWKNLAELGYGFWPEPQLEKAPDYFNVEHALRIIGYTTQNLSGAIKAFKLHYIQTEVDDTLDEKTINTIYSIYKKQ